MALGDGIRRNIATVSQEERERLRDAFIKLQQKAFPGDREDPIPGGVTYWFKQDEIHAATHVHGGAAFLPWHRELCNRLEAMLREEDPDLSLHYWDWNTDPAGLFTTDFMGSANGDAGEPWLGAGFYDPDADPFRADSAFDPNNNPFDPPRTLVRNKGAGAPSIGSADADTLAAETFPEMRELLEDTHNGIHPYIGGTIGDPHTAFRDPFVFLLHSNVDRLFATWQAMPGKAWRLDPNQVYGEEGNTAGVNGILTPLDPWAGNPTNNPSIKLVRPWAAPENQQVFKDSKHPSVVRPPCYDTLSTYPPTVTLETPSINFNDVPTGETAARAVVFSAVSCQDVHLSITAGPTVLTGPAGTNFGTFPAPLGTSVTIPHISSSTPPVGRLWISYKGTSPLDGATGSVTVHCDETNQDFIIPIAANTIARPTVAVMLVLDQSGSMDWLAGIDPTTKRIDVLHQAAMQFVQIAQDSSRVGDGVGMVSFDHEAHPGVAVTKNMGTGLDFGPVVTAIQNLHPAGATSIGNGVALGRDNLNPVTGYDQKAMVVFTDGLENTSLYIADVMGSINDRTFAIGLGTAQVVSVGALTALANNTGGYLLLSGRLSPSIDDYFRLSKFFMQVLAGVTNTNIVTDPTGYVAPGMKVRIPFVLNDTDINSTVILLTDGPGVRFLIETPAGDVMDPAQAGTIGATYAVGTNMSYYRFTLPLPLGMNPAQEGTWYALLEVDDIIINARRQISAARAAQAIHGVRYNLSVQSYSNLRMQAGLSQNSLQPGATLTVRAALSEYGIPVDHRATVHAELERPDNSKTTLTLAEIEPGIFEASTLAAIQGVYRFRLLASGFTMRGIAFTREQLLSGTVVLGGDNPPPTTVPPTTEQDKQLCDLIECLLKPEACGRFLMEHKIDPDTVKGCIEKWCNQRGGTPSEEELRRREGTSPASR